MTLNDRKSWNEYLVPWVSYLLEKQDSTHLFGLLPCPSPSILWSLVFFFQPQISTSLDQLSKVFANPHNPHGSLIWISSQLGQPLAPKGRHGKGQKPRKHFFSPVPDRTLFILRILVKYHFLGTFPDSSRQSSIFGFPQYFAHAVVPHSPYLWFHFPQFHSPRVIHQWSARVRSNDHPFDVLS